MVAEAVWAATILTRIMLKAKGAPFQSRLDSEAEIRVWRSSIVSDEVPSQKTAVYD